MRKRNGTGRRNGCQQQVQPAEVRSLAESMMTQALKLEAHGYSCTTSVLLQVLYWAAARAVSISAACVTLAQAPGDQTIRDALRACLPKRVKYLEDRLNKALTANVPHSLCRRARRIAIDWHQIPYHGQPLRSPEELRRGQPRAGTSTFHDYATACVVEHGQRFTLALTRVLKSDSNITVLERLYRQIASLDIKTKVLLLDRQFYTTNVIDWLQRRQVPFVIPVSLRGRKPRAGAKPKGLRALLKARPGWSCHRLRAGKTQVSFSICICWKMVRHAHRKTVHRKVMLYACWRVKGAPKEIRDLYRRRFGIEASYRQLGKYRIRTSTRDPLLRLLFVGLALLLRNIWVWLHWMRLARISGNPHTVQLIRLRLSHLVEIINHTLRHPKQLQFPVMEIGNY